MYSNQSGKAKINSSAEILCNPVYLQAVDSQSCSFRCAQASPTLLYFLELLIVDLIVHVFLHRFHIYRVSPDIVDDFMMA